MGQQAVLSTIKLVGKLVMISKMENVEAHVTTTELVKTAKEYKDGTYTWEASVKFDIDRLKGWRLDREAAGKAIQEMVITDKLSGPHKLK